MTSSGSSRSSSRATCPRRNEELLTFVDGRAFVRSAEVFPYRLDQDADLVERWSTIARSDRGGVDTPAGRVEYLAVPVVLEGETRGVFVAAIFRNREAGEVDDAVRVAAGVGLAMLLVGSVLAWLLADRVLRPVKARHGHGAVDLGRRSVAPHSRVGA